MVHSVYLCVCCRTYDSIRHTYMAEDSWHNSRQHEPCGVNAEQWTDGCSYWYINNTSLLTYTFTSVQQSVHTLLTHAISSTSQVVTL